MKEISINGEVYRLPEADGKLLGRFHSWATKNVPEPPDPIKVAKQLLEELGLPASSAVAEKIILDAYNRKVRIVTKTPAEREDELQAVMMTEEGTKELVRLLFERYHPDLSAEQAFSVHMAAVLEHGEDYLEKHGVIPTQKKVQ